MKLWQTKVTPIAICTFLFALSLSTNAQVTTADLVGTVEDDAGAVVNGPESPYGRKQRGAAQRTLCTRS